MDAKFEVYLDLSKKLLALAGRVVTQKSTRFHSRFTNCRELCTIGQLD